MSNSKSRFSVGLTAFSLLWCLLGASLPNPPSQLAAQQDRNWEKKEREAKNFRPAKDLLLERGVPFNPDSLREPGWQKTLAPLLASMPEMREVRRYGQDISGLLIGETLYFPEKVTLVGNTVILANKIMFEGKEVEITGSFSIYIYPVMSKGVLGTSLETAMDEQFSGTAYENASTQERLRAFVPKPMRDNFKFKIDVSPRPKTEKKAIWTIE